MKWVVACETNPGDVTYLGFQLMGDEVVCETWWLVAPGEASGKVGHVDYHRFEREEDAVAWCLILQASAESRGYSSGYKYYVRQIE